MSVEGLNLFRGLPFIILNRNASLGKGKNEKYQLNANDSSVRRVWLSSGCEAGSKKVKRTTLHQMVTLKKFLSTRSQPDKNELLNVFNMVVVNFPNDDCVSDSGTRGVSL